MLHRHSPADSKSELISRRTFVSDASRFAAALPFILGAHTRAGPTIRVGVADFSPAATSDRDLGLTIGAEEATHAAALFGGTFQLVPIDPSDTGLAGISALIGNADCDRTRHTARAGAAAGIPFFNVACSADDLRGAGCVATMFHVSPSDAMRRDALAAAHATGDVVAWHSSLSRFGADTLNRRFSERFHRPMTSDSWTAWLATKIIWESGLRVASGDSRKLIEYLARDSTQFDGHKGLPLSFRSWDRQLRQPLYVVHGNEVVDVPAGTAAGEPVREVLDRLGTNEHDSACHSSQ